MSGSSSVRQRERSQVVPPQYVAEVPKVGSGIGQERPPPGSMSLSRSWRPSDLKRRRGSPAKRTARMGWPRRVPAVIAESTRSSWIRAPFRATACAQTAGISEFERSLIQERTSSGRQAARARGVRFGRPKKLSHDQIAPGRRLVGEGRHGLPSDRNPVTLTSDLRQERTLAR